MTETPPSPRPELTLEQAIAALRWWAEAGVDLALDEAPHDRFAESAAPPPRRVAPEPVRAPASVRAPAAAPAPAVPEEAVRSAWEAAAAARTLEDLRAALESFEGCGLKKTATQLVFADGAPGASIMIVGEAPGAEEDRVGRPLVGKGGQLFDRMLGAIGLDRTSVYIVNVVPWRPPGNRTPTPQEMAACLPFVLRQIELAGPSWIVCLGAAATSALTGGRESLSRARGQWREYRLPSGRVLPILPMFHPDYLLRQPAQKRLAWADLRKLRASVASGAPV